MKMKTTLLIFLGSLLGVQSAQPLELHTRSRIRSPQDSNQWQVVERTVHWAPAQTAVVVCDMWQRHWCKGATKRVAELAPRMNRLLLQARAQGVLIIHCPSGGMDFYAGTPPRRLAQAAPKIELKIPLQDWVGLDRAVEGLLPIDDSDGGCDCTPQCSQDPQTVKAVMDGHQTSAIEIRDGDAITDSTEALYLMRERGIANVIVMGVHLNMCVLGRPFAIRQMVRQAQNVLLVRDLTDTMYNSRRRPFVPHCAGNDLMTEHVEQYWCPSIASTDFLGDEPLRFSEDVRPLVLFMIGEDEYRTEQTLPEFAQSELAWRGIRCAFAQADPVRKNEFPGLTALPEADLLFISVRRRTPSNEQMDCIRRHLAAGKGMVGIRTASHAFGATPPDRGHQGWTTFDAEVLGGNYQGHYNNHPPKDPPTLLWIRPEAAGHPVLTGVPTNELRVTSWLYRSRRLAATVTPLMSGRVEGRSEIEPVAWVNTNRDCRVFYTSLGSPNDFQLPAFRRLLLNGTLWALRRPIPPETGK